MNTSSIRNASAVLDGLSKDEFLEVVQDRMRREGITYRNPNHRYNLWRMDITKFKSVRAGTETDANVPSEFTVSLFDKSQYTHTNSDVYFQLSTYGTSHTYVLGGCFWTLHDIVENDIVTNKKVCVAYALPVSEDFLKQKLYRDDSDDETEWDNLMIKMDKQLRAVCAVGHNMESACKQFGINPKRANWLVSGEGPWSPPDFTTSRSHTPEYIRQSKTNDPKSPDEEHIGVFPLDYAPGANVETEINLYGRGEGVQYFASMSYNRVTQEYVFRPYTERNISEDKRSWTVRYT